jgi:outer membrane protein assembly factor BamB
VADGLCIVHFGDSDKGKALGGVTAFDAATGEVKWCYAEGSRASSSSPIVVDLAGERQVVLCTSWNLLGLSLATGKRLWSLRLTSIDGAKIVTPLRYKDLVIFGDAKEPLRAVRLEKGDKGITVKEVWKSNRLPLYMSSPVVEGKLLFGMSTRKRGCFFCLDADSGKTLWESADNLGAAGHMGNASILNAGKVILFLTNGGRLVVAKPSAARYEPIAEYRVSDTQTWAHPIFLGDRILIRDAATLRLSRIGKGADRP